MQVSIVDFAPKDELMLSVYASISRNETPLDFTELDFKSTILHNCINSGHPTVPQMATYWFHITGITRTCLMQMSAYRMRTMIVNSGRYIESDKISLPIDDEEMLHKMSDLVYTYMDKVNEEFKGVLPYEDLRMLYPEVRTVNLIWKIDGLNLRNFLKQRLNKEAQWEIRSVAEKMYDLVKETHPTMVLGINKDGNNPLSC